LLTVDAFTLAKSIHLITLTITITGFILRGIWMVKGSPLLHARAVKIVPHVNDTVLLISAVWTGALINQYPFVDAWLTAKILGAIAYILFGAVALTYGKTKQIRISCFIMALLSFAYVVAVATTKNPLIAF
jgi:uncharacterized membrane protein SirB2